MGRWRNRLDGGLDGGLDGRLDGRLVCPAVTAVAHEGQRCPKLAPIRDNLRA